MLKHFVYCIPLVQIVAVVNYIANDPAYKLQMGKPGVYCALQILQGIGLKGKIIPHYIIIFVLLSTSCQDVNITPTGMYIVI